MTAVTELAKTERNSSVILNRNPKTKPPEFQKDNHDQRQPRGNPKQRRR